MLKKLLKNKIRKKNITKYLENKNPKEINCTNKNYKNRSLIYSKEGKQIVRENKGMIKDLLELSKSKKTKINTENYEINKLKHSNNTTNRYVFIDKKKSKKYFIKEINLKNRPSFVFKLNEFNGYKEFLGLKILNKFKLNIIEPKIAYKDNKKTYIMYDFTNLENIKYTQNLTLKDKYKIEKKLFDLNFKINNQLKMENKNELIYDVTIKNAYIDLKNKKIYLADPYISYIGELH